MCRTVCGVAVERRRERAVRHGLTQCVTVIYMWGGTLFPKHAARRRQSNVFADGSYGADGAATRADGAGESEALPGPYAHTSWDDDDPRWEVRVEMARGGGTSSECCLP